MKRIYVKAYTNMNFGDDLFVYILCKRYPDVQFYISCSRFVDKPFEMIPNLTIMNRKHIKGMVIQNVKRAMNKLGISVNYPFDGEVFIGGSIFIQPQDWYAGSDYEKELYLYPINMKIPFFILGANFGPYEDENFKVIHQKFFEQEVSDVCFRDKWSYKLFRNLKNVRFAPDIVCTYSVPRVKKENLILISCIRFDGREGLSLFDNEQYIQKMVDLCDWYLESGKKVCLLSMCKNQGDEISCLEIKKRCKSDVELLFYSGDIEMIMGYFARAEYVIASRFHAMILGWVVHTPVFPICYNNKTEQVIWDYEYTGNYTKIQEFHLLKNEEVDANRKNNYLFNIADLRTQAEQQFCVLDKFLTR